MARWEKSDPLNSGRMFVRSQIWTTCLVVIVCNWVGTRSLVLDLLSAMTGAVCYWRAEKISFAVSLNDKTVTVQHFFSKNVVTFDELIGYRFRKRTAAGPHRVELLCKTRNVASYGLCINAILLREATPKERTFVDELMDFTVLREDPPSAWPSANQNSK